MENQMTHKTIKVTQLNMARSRAVSDELLHHCIRGKIDVALVQEPYTSWGMLHGFEYGATRTIKSKPNAQHGIWAAIIVFNSSLDIISKPQLTTEHTVVLGVAFPGQPPIDLVSSYFQFRRPTEHFTNEITRIHASLLDRIVLGIDVNAFSPKWYDHRHNEKGRLVEDMISNLDLIILNKPGYEQTFQGARGKSNVDVTLASPGIINCIRNWQVIKGATTSDHLIITFEIADQIDELLIPPRIKFLDNKINKLQLVEAVKNALEATRSDDSINGLANHITSSLKLACEQTLPKSTASKPKLPPWWNAEVAGSRRNLISAHRSMLRLKTPEARESFRLARNRHVCNIRKAKQTIWQKFTNDPLPMGNTWGRLTKWLIKGKNEQPIPSVLRKHDGSYTSSSSDTISYMLNELIPTSVSDQSIVTATHSCCDSPQITSNELSIIVKKQRNSAPGADGLSARIIKAAWPALSCHMLRLTNRCLRSAQFPDPWKAARIVVLLKSKDKDPLLPKSYRPVSLLPVLGKILEEVICDIAEREIGNKLSHDQHGFRPGKSTTTALDEVKGWTSHNGRHVLGSFLDISGAFDNVRWPMLFEDMRSLQCSPTISNITMS